ncbi:hypothetical protein [Streptomyces sp. AC1-42W]|uniref:hypothetical protein n=1 Tax=Streptomyces sp. AC1-42W TaxID=2218666 RepID=UPI0011B93EE2|nr:hypothetical protein [Streptomyces sp. AC1-42W]
MDAPAVVLENLTPQQRDGRSCCWCSYWASDRYPVPLLRRAGLRLRACETCAAQYGISAMDAP